jgi:creatinine amidohydrolase
MKSFLLSFLIIFSFSPLLAQQNPSTRDMTLINWMEFAEYVPRKVNTVLLPAGTLEPHGVINNGADNTAPQAMANDIAEELNALIASTLNYGITGRMAAWDAAKDNPIHGFAYLCLANIH